MIKDFVKCFALWTLLGSITKVMFLLAYQPLLDDADLTEQLLAIWHGLRLDIAIAGYLTLIPGLLLIVREWYRGTILRGIWRTYFAITASITSLAYISNLGLYGYWGFPLDNTPLLYIKTSPADAMASMTAWQMILAPVAIIALALATYCAFDRATAKGFKDRHSNNRQQPLGRRITLSIVMLLMTASLILPIRGGVGTGTNHTGSVYFSSNIRINHAAVNPIFCFIESVTHQEEIGSRYRFMKDEEAAAIFRTMTATSLRKDARRQDYNIVLIGLESFSDTIMHIDGVTPHLNALKEEGLYFRNFYANSFRTDRALVAIHSGLPAQPTMSVMDIPHKSTSLPSIAGILAKHGYATTFYYGGDINYSNMRSYFIGTGFQKTVSDSDFPSKLHTGKWGVADGPVFDRLLQDIKSDNSGIPFFRSFMTGSSHEPFDVPDYHHIPDSPELNAFAYTDECLGRFISQLRQLPCWKSTIVVIVPDHLGAYPVTLDNYQQWRFHIPLIIMGGAVDATRYAEQVAGVYGSQIDIAATICGMTGIDHSDFTYSKDLLDPSIPHFAYYTFPDAMAMVTDTSAVLYDNTSAKIHHSQGKAETLLKQAKAYLQILYDDLDRR